MYPEVWIVDDAGVVAAVVDADLIDVAVATPVDIVLELELEALPSTAAHILASPCRPAVISELILLSEPHFEEEHWTAGFPPVSRLASIAVQTQL